MSFQCVSVRGLQPNDPSVLYCGRACYGWIGSPLGNPFKAGRDGTLPEVLDKYWRWIWKQVYAKNQGVLDALRKITPESRLGCWCYTGPARNNRSAPQRCHTEMIWQVWQDLKKHGQL